MPTATMLPLWLPGEPASCRTLAHGYCARVDREHVISALPCDMQESKIERLMKFLESPKQLSDKDLAAAVGSGVLSSDEACQRVCSAGSHGPGARTCVRPCGAAISVDTHLTCLPTCAVQDAKKKEKAKKEREKAKTPKTTPKAKKGDVSDCWQAYICLMPFKQCESLLCVMESTRLLRRCCALCLYTVRQEVEEGGERGG